MVSADRFARDVALLDNLVALAAATLDRAAQRHPPDGEPRVVALVFRTLARALGAGRATRLLFANGFEAEAAAPARTLFELAVDVLYIASIAARDEQDKEAKAFMEWEDARIGLHVENLMQTGATPEEIFSVATAATGMSVDQIHADIQARRAAARAENEFKSERDWSKMERRRRAEKCRPSLIEQYDTAYRALCDTTHSSGSALVGFSAKVADGERYMPEPKPPRSAMFISIATRTLGLLTTIAMHALGEHPAPAMAVLDELQVLERSKI